jgi:hypothetical protein
MMFYQENWNVEQRMLNFEIVIVIEITSNRIRNIREYKICEI